MRNGGHQTGGTEPLILRTQGIAICQTASKAQQDKKLAQIHPVLVALDECACFLLFLLVKLLGLTHWLTTLGGIYKAESNLDDWGANLSNISFQVPA